MARAADFSSCGDVGDDDDDDDPAWLWCGRMPARGRSGEDRSIFAGGWVREDDIVFFFPSRVMSFVVGCDFFVSLVWKSVDAVREGVK